MVSPAKQNVLELSAWPALQLYLQGKEENEANLHTTIKTQMQEEYDEQQWWWGEGYISPVMSSLWVGGL